MANNQTPIPLDLGVVVTRLESNERNVNSLTDSIAKLTAEWRTAMSDRTEQARKEMSDLSNAVNHKIENLGSTFNSKIEGVTANITGQISGIASDIKKKSEIPWQALGVMLSAVIVLIGLLYWPIQGKQSDLSDAIKETNASIAKLSDAVLERYVQRAELETLQMRGREDRERSNRALETLQGNVFPKEVHEQRWARFDSDIAALNLRTETQVQNLQREIDALQRLLGDQFTARDALLENKERISKLEDLIREIVARARPGP